MNGDSFDTRIHASVDDLQAQLKRAANDWNAAVRALQARGYTVYIPTMTASTPVERPGEIGSFEVGTRVKVAS